jgi:hypothetical protein
VFVHEVFVNEVSDFVEQDPFAGVFPRGGYDNVRLGVGLDHADVLSVVVERVGALKVDRESLEEAAVPLGDLCQRVLDIRLFLLPF